PTLPDWIADLNNLEVLRLESVKNGLLPTFLNTLPRLHTLDLRGCFEIITNESIVESVLENFPNLKIIPFN
ncbi:MAG: hypothetical protein AAGA66_04120, partial [Bacteroidota bacterium]